MSEVANIMALHSFQKILWIYQPTEISPGWERWIAGRRIGEIEFCKESLGRQVCLWKSHKLFYRANPRSLEVLINIARNRGFLTGDLQHELMFVGETTLPIECQSLFQKVKSLKSDSEDPFRDEALGMGNVAVVFLYPDPIGMGWENLEKKIFVRFKKNIFALNGRGRFFRVDRNMFKKLRWRRSLARSFLCEIILCFFLPFLGGLLGGIDCLARISTFFGRRTHE